MTTYKLPPITISVLSASSRQKGLDRDQRLEYARILRDFAQKCRDENDLKNAEFNDWVASNYEV